MKISKGFNRKLLAKLCLGFSFLLIFSAQATFAQTEMAPWGNINGIRVGGQLVPFESALCVMGKNGKITSTGREKQRPKYHREGNAQLVSTNIDSLFFSERVVSQDNSTAAIAVEMNAHADTTIAGTFVSIRLPNDYANAMIEVNGSAKVAISKLAGSGTLPESIDAQSIRLITQKQQLMIRLPTENASFILQKNASTGNYILLLPIEIGAVKNGQTAKLSFSIQASAEIDTQPITLTLNTAKTGRAFAGFGGNFRLQNPKTDPQVIDYCLQNLRVAWGRVEMPFRFWQPEKNSDPTKMPLDSRVQHAMEMAQRLGKMNIPVILTAWSAPDWAIVGKANFKPVNGVWGNPLDKNSMPAIYKSIADYIVYMKDYYGVEAKLFSFNESDLGINIRQTGEEHDALIKGLGAYFISRGLKTKLLLGDNSDATTYKFIDPAMNDPAAKPYIGAISFHSWRGWETDILQKWADAATKLQLPLIVGEGSIDAAAWNYPAVFEEPTYALQEINLYTRLLAICQPISILQWQLTADYSPLAGGGIFGDNGPLRPTQRFWNLKQLSATPKNVFAMPLQVNGNDVSGAALGNNKTGVYSIQLVNNGATRQVTLTGLPLKVKTLKMYITDQKRNMQEEKPIAVVNGKVTFQLDTQSYMSLMNE